MNMLAPPPVRLGCEVVFDLVCPWCWIGLRRLKRTLAQRPDLVVDVTFRSFLLNPEMPARGLPQGEYLQRKFGGEDRARRLQAAIIEVGRQEGIVFRFDRIQRTPPTLQAHRLVRLAAREGRAWPVIEALFAAHFRDGRDIGDRAVLAAIANEAGLNRSVLAAFAADDAETERVMLENLRSHRLGINGVPCFVVAGRHAVAGAQEPEVIERLLELAAMDQSGVL
ncbi:MAG: DsbA family oxidoreductase [Acetobacteraceae bacterium]|nr:DsbA family oxidoreductase [Acetobacteraceae bacterium]